MEEANYNVCDLKPSILERMLEEQRRMTPNLRSNLTYIRRFAAAKRRSQRLLVENPELQQWMKTKT